MKPFMLFCHFFLFLTILSSVGCGKSTKTWPEAKQYFNNPKEIALCQAIEKQDIEAIDKLVAEGVDVNAKGDDGMRFLLWAFPAPKSFQRLLEHGADPNFTIEKEFKVCGVYLNKDDTLLMRVSMKFCDNFREYLPLLLKHGADPNAGKIPPLYLACSRAFEDRDVEMIKQLVEAGADLNASDGPREIRYIVSKCALLERYKVLLYLLECGAEYRTNTKPGGQMQRFLLEKRQEYNNYLKKRKAGEIKLETELEKRNDVGLAALHADREKVISWLEKHGVNFDKPVPESESQERPKPFRVKPKNEDPPKAKEGLTKRSRLTKG